MISLEKMDGFKHSDWTKIWAGTWSFLSCSHFGLEYTQLIKFGGKPFISQAVIFYSEGKSNCWATQSDRDALGKFLSNEIKSDSNKAAEVCASLKSEVDEILKYINSVIDSDIDLKVYDLFWEKVVKYYHPHIYVKYVVDYLDPVILKKNLHQLEEARVYAEPVFKRTEDFVNKLIGNIFKVSGIPTELLKCLSDAEVRKYLITGSLPDKNILEERNKNSVLLFDKNDYGIFSGDEVSKIESEIIVLQNDQQFVKGAIGFSGKVAGKVKIVLDPAKAEGFEEGDILVAGMTRPDYLSLMKKAAAFVTDGGGILCHAAIVARELKKPCVIGTQKATKIFKDGDTVEVDANEGIVRKI